MNKDIGHKIADEYRMRMCEEMTDIELRSKATGKLSQMKQLSAQILNDLTNKVVTKIAGAHVISVEDVAKHLAENPLRPSDPDPFGKHRGIEHLLD